MELTGSDHPLELIEKALEGSLTPPEEELLAGHLKTCSACSGEINFARQSRSAIKAHGAGKVPEPLETGRMLALLETRLADDDSGRNRIPLLAGALAASLLLAWVAFNPGGLSRWLATRPAVSLANSSIGLPQAELREALRFFSISGPADGFMRSPLLAVQIADFESAGEMAGISVAGGGIFHLTDDAVSGKRSLTVEPGPDARSGVEILLPVRSMNAGVMPVAVSVWVKSTRTASISLSVRMPEGDIRESSDIREAKPGQWVWAFLPLPVLNAIERARMAGLGIRVLGGGPVALDHVELWCRGGGGG